MKKFIFSIVICTIFSTYTKAAIWPLSSGDVSAIYSNVSFLSGDTIELNSAGNYSWTTKITNLNKSFALRASAGLASRPVVDLPAGVSITTLNSAVSYNLNMDGIDFNGNNVATGLINAQAITGGDVIVSMNNCIVRNFSSTAVVFVYSSTGAGWAKWYGPLQVTNTRFYGPFANIISAGAAYRAPNNTTFDNCYIKKVSGYAIGMMTPGAQSVTVNHCTFDSCGTTTLKSAEIWIKYGDATVVSVKNSLFANREISTVANLFGNPNNTNTNNAIYYTGTANVATLYPAGLGTYISSNPTINSYNYAASATHTSAAADGKVIGFSPKLNITVSPSTTSLITNQTKQFSATVTDSLSAFIPTLNWSATAGSIDATGLYTASTAGNNIAVTASNYGFSGNATVNVGGINVNITPNAPTIYLGYPIQFSAQAVNQDNEVQPGTATWSTTGNIGTIDQNTGNFVPSSLGNGTIKATIGANSKTINITVIPPSTTVSITMGTHQFSWKFDKVLEHGTFVDGQPWIILPASGANLLSVTPSRIVGASVKDRSGATITADINQTVINPPVGTYYQNNSGGVLSRKAFGWDSRGGIRYATPTDSNYDAALAWDGVSPVAVNVGDIITSAVSLTSQTPDDTALDALAVLSVLEQAPPADAFRPGSIRSAARKANPEFIKVSDIIDLSPYLIPAPATTILSDPITGIDPMFLATRLTNLMPGPSFVNYGLIFNRSFNAVYNNSGNGYGADVAAYTGDVAIGALAAWLTPEERNICRVHLIQRAVDIYESLLAGVVLSYNGGHTPGYGALLTIAGKMLNHTGMTNVNKSVNGREPMYYISDYAQSIYIDDSETNYNDGITPDVGNPRRIKSNSTLAPVNLTIIPIASATDGNLVVNNSYIWQSARAGLAVPNLKLKIESGAGAGNQYYVVTGIKDFIDLSTGFVSNDLNAYDIKAGTLQVKPTWKNGMPDATSVIRAYLSLPSETPCWAFKQGGMNAPDGTYIYEYTLSPSVQYGTINVRAYLTYFMAMYALNAHVNYSGGLDRWLIRACTLPGYGEQMFTDGNSRNPNGIKNYNGSLFLSGLLKSQILDKVGATYAGTSTLGVLTSLQVPENLTTIYEKSADNNLVTITKSNTSIRIQSKNTIYKLKIFSLAGLEISSKDVNNYSLNIDKKSLMAGYYILQIIDENGTHNQKIIL